MLVKPPMENLLPKTENRYTLAILAAKRTRQLVSGARPMAESETPNLVTLACEEIAAGKVVEVHDVVDPVVPLRPEIEAARLASKTEEEAEANLDTLRSNLAMMQSQAEEEAEPQPRRTMIKILGEGNRIMTADDYFNVSDEENEMDEDDELNLGAVLFDNDLEEDMEAEMQDLEVLDEGIDESIDEVADELVEESDADIEAEYVPSDDDQEDDYEG